MRTSFHHHLKRSTQNSSAIHKLPAVARLWVENWDVVGWF